VRELLERQARQWDEHGLSLWWWRERATGELVGMGGLNRAEVEGEPCVEVGWSLPTHRHDQGFATELGRASIEWGRAELGLERIVAFTLPENERSRAVMERLGMTYVRDFRRKGLPHVLYEAPATG